METSASFEARYAPLLYPTNQVVTGARRIDATVTSLCGKEAENLAHNALALIRLEEVLRMGGAVKDDQLFRFGGFFIIRTNPWQPRSVAAGVVARYNE